MHGEILASGDVTPSGLAPAGALAQSSRRSIAEELAASPEGLGVAEIAERVGLHHNAVRQHLRTLAAAGVISSVRDRPKGRGRPRERFFLVDDEAPVSAAHAELVRLLVGLVSFAGIDERQVEAFGRAAALQSDDRTVRDGIVTALARLGFAPRDIAGAGSAEAGVVDVCLEFCPFREAVLAPGGGAICTLHKGFVGGLAARESPGARVTLFEPRDPRTAGCRVRVEGLSRPTAA